METLDEYVDKNRPNAAWWIDPETGYEYWISVTGRWCLIWDTGYDLYIGRISIKHPKLQTDVDLQESAAFLEQWIKACVKAGHPVTTC